MSGTSVTLSWSASSGATYYSLGVRDMASGALVVDTNVSGTSFTASLSAGKQYRWNVAACNTAGCSSFTTPLYFQTPTPVSIPATPLNPSPGSPTSPGPTMSGTSVTLSWSASSGATYYSLGVRDMASGALVVDTNVSGTSFTASLSAGKQYRWNVAACNTAGCSSFTTPLYFQTPTPVSIPATPLNPSPGSPTSPGPTMSGTSVTLSWSASSGATYYSLGVRDMASGALVVDTNVSGTSFTASLSAGKQYRWNVAACNTAGCSSFTTPLYFQTPTPVSIPATPLNPSPGSPTSPGPTMSGTSVTLSWSASSGATYYSLGVRDMTSGALVVDTNVNGTSFTASLSAGKQYRWNVAACNTAGCSSFTTPLYFQTPDAAPSITAYSTSPSSPAAGQPFTINISGNNFNASTAQILFTGPGCSPCTVPNGALSTKSATLLIGPVTLNTAGTYTVAVQNGSGGATSNGLSLTIGGATPLLSGLSTNPNPPVVGQQFTLTISGSSFDPSTVQILVFGTGCGPCTVPNGVLTTKTATQIAGPVTLNSAGSFDIRVQNGSGGGQSNSLSLTVGAAAPSITAYSTSPSSPAAGQPFTINISGNNFNASTAQILFTGPGCSPCTVPNGALSTKSATLLIGPVTLNTAGTYTVAVQNGSGGATSNGLSLTIGGATPLLSGLSTNPNPPVVGQQFTLTISGSSFDPSTVQILVFGTGCGPCTVPNGVLTTKTATQIAGPVTLNSAGSFDIRVQNGSGGGQSNSLSLTVGAAAPSITAYSTSPSSPAAGQPFTINISGNNFNASTAQILFTGPGCSPCTVPNGALSTKSATLLIGPVTLNTAGTYTVAVQNGSGGATSNGLSLTIGGATPLLSGLSTNPNPPVVGQQFTLTISGSSFDPSTVQILVFGTGCGPCTVPNGVLTTKTATQIAGPVTLNSAGSFDIRVQNGSGGGQSNSLSLTVGAAAPSITAYSTSPSSPAAGQPFTINISGNNFNASTAQILFTGPGCSPCTVPNGALSTKSATLLIGPVTLNTAGTYTVAVQNGSGGATSNGLSLTIGGATPLLSGLSTNPNPPVVGQQFTLTISGSSFDPSTVQILVFGTGCGPCTVPNGVLTTKTATQIAGPVTLNSAGSFDIRVQNGSGGGQSNSLSLTVGAAAPSITAYSTSPSSPAAGQPFTINISGNNFNASTAQILFTGPGCSPCTVPNGALSTKSATLLIGPVTLNTAGTYTVAVQNGSGGATSNGLSLTIGGATPLLSGLSTNPNPPVVGQQFTLTISGSSFDPSTVQILVFGTGCGPCTVPNGVLTTKTATQIAGPVTLNSAGSFDIRVQNGSGGGQSNSLSLTVGAAAPAPAVSWISPTTMPADGVSRTLTVYGSNFQSGNIVQFRWGVGAGAGVWNTGTGNPPNILSSSQMTISMNPGTVTDTIYVRVCRSASQTGSEDCSSGTHSVTVTGAGVPDLVPGSLVISPNPVQAGQRLSFSFSVRNAGSAAATATTTTRVQLSGSASAPSLSDPLLASLATPPLGIGASVALSGSGTVPSSLAPGTYYVWVIVDADNQLSGQNTANDRIAVPVTVLASGTADLASLASETDAGGLQLSANQVFTKRWTLRNTGTSTWDSRYRLQFVSGNAGCSHSDVTVTETVALNSTYTFSLSCTAPTTPGTYREDWRLVGPSGPIPVSGSNTIWLIIRVTGGTDGATFVSETVPDGTLFAPSEAFSKTWRVRNTGQTVWNNYRLVFITRPESGADSVNLHAAGLADAAVLLTSPSQTVDITVPMRAPETPGTYRSYWQLQTPGGTRFGPQLWTLITVRSSQPGGSIMISATQRYESTLNRLILTARAKDEYNKPVEAGSFSWSLRDAANNPRASGNLQFANGEWTAAQSIPGGLPPGRYTVLYDLTSGSKTGQSTATLIVEGTFDLEGRVRDLLTSQPIEGALVSAATQTSRTNSRGEFYLSGLRAESAPTIKVTKPPYATYEKPLVINSASRRVVLDDIWLRLSGSGNKPIVTSVDVEAGKLFLGGVPLYREYTATVAWNGSPGTVRFEVNDSVAAEVRGDANGAKARIRLDFSLSLALRVKVVAKNGEGVSSDPFEKTVYATPFPSTLVPFRAALWIEEDGNDIVYVLDFNVKGPQKTLQIPILGKFGGEFSANGHFDYRNSDGAFRVALGAGPDYSATYVGLRAFGSREFIPNKIRFFIGKAEIEGNLQIEANGIARITEPIRIHEVEGNGSIQANLPAGKYGLLDIWPGLTKLVTHIPGADRVVNVVSVEVRVIVGIDGKVMLAVTPQFGFKQWDMTGTVGLQARYWPADGDHLGIRFTLTGTTGVTLQYPGDLFRQLKLTAEASAEFYAKLLWFSGEKAFRHIWEWTYPDSGGTTAGEGSGSRSEAQPLKRDYLASGLARFVVHEPRVKDAKTASSSGLDVFRAMSAGGAPSTAQANLTLIENVFPYGNSSLAASGSELMLLYVSDNGSPGRLQFTDINWTRFDGNDWSTPAPIVFDTRAEFEPRVAYDGNGEAVAVWERVKSEAFDTADLSALASNLEIVWSRFDRATGRWITPEPLTNNSYADHAPLLVGPLADGSLILVWTANEANLLTGEGPEGSNRNDWVIWSRWDPAAKRWSAPQVLISNLSLRTSQSLAGAGSKAVYAWTRDLDGDLNTRGDAEVFYVLWDGKQWSAPGRLTNDQVVDQNVRAAVGPSGEVYMVWQRGDDLVLDRNLGRTPAVVRADSTSLGFLDFVLAIGPAGNLALFWQGQTQYGPDAHVKIFDPASSTWSEDIPLFDDPPLERALAPTWDRAGNLTLAYHRVNTDGPGGFGRVDLGVLKRSLAKNLTIGPGDFVADAARFSPGESVRLWATVRNTGDVAVGDVTVSFYAGAPGTGGRELARTIIPGWLRGGSSAVVEASAQLPEIGGPTQLAVLVDPEGRVAEVDKTDNMAVITVGGADLSVRLKSARADSDGAARIVIEVANIGAPGTPAGTAGVWNAGQSGAPLASAQVPELSPGRMAQVALDLPTGSVRSSLKFVVRVDVAGDINTRNNTLDVSLSPPEDSTPLVESPVFSPGSGTYPAGQIVRITCATEDAIIHYTTNGEEPTEDDPVVPSGSGIRIEEAITLKARAWKSGAIPSAVTTAVYVLSRTGPSIAPESLVNGASFGRSGGFAPGSLVSIFGGGLSDRDYYASSLPLPARLGQTSVLVNGTPAPLLYVGPTQVNFQLPPGLTGESARIVVLLGEQPSAEITVGLAVADPAVFLVGQTGYGVITKANTDILAMPTSPGVKAEPAKKGELVTIYCTGLGPLRFPVAAGVPANGPVEVVHTPEVRVGGVSARVLYAGLAPGFVGVNQINIELPENAPTGAAVPVTIAVSGRTSPAVNIAVE